MPRPPGVGRVRLRGIGFTHRRHSTSYALDALCTVSRARGPFAPWLTESVVLSPRRIRLSPFKPSNIREFVEGQQPRFGKHREVGSFRQHRFQVREVFVLRASRQSKCSLRDTKFSVIEDFRACSRRNIGSRRCRLGWRPRGREARRFFIGREGVESRRDGE